MQILILITMIGMTAGAIAIAISLLVDRAKRGRARTIGDRDIRDVPGRTGVLTSGTPYTFLGGIGSNARPQITLDTVTMRPTLGFKLCSIAILGLIGFVALTIKGDPMTLLLAAAMSAYLIGLLTRYEVTYNGEGVTIPNVLFQKKRYDWADFERIERDSQNTYRIYFEGSGKIVLHRHLVGMATFLDFVVDVRNSQQR